MDSSTTGRAARARRGLLAAIALLLVCATSAPAATVLSFVPSAAEVNCNEIVEIDVTIDGGAVDLRGYSIEIEYDSTLLQLIDVVPGQLMVDAPCDPFLWWTLLDPDRMLIDAAGLGCSVAGPGAIARLRMKGLADGVSPLTGASVILRNSANLPIAASWTNGQVLVNCPVDNASSAWSTLKAEYR